MYIVHNAIHHTTSNDGHTSLLHSTAYYNLRSCLNRQHSLTGFFSGGKNENTAQWGLEQAMKWKRRLCTQDTLEYLSRTLKPASESQNIVISQQICRDCEITACRRSCQAVGCLLWGPCVFWRHWQYRTTWRLGQMDRQIIFASDRRHIVGMLGHQC